MEEDKAMVPEEPHPVSRSDSLSVTLMTSVCHQLGQFGGCSDPFISIFGGSR